MKHTTRGAKPPRRIEFTKELEKEFEKDWRVLQHAGIDPASPKEAMSLLGRNIFGRKLFA